MQASIFFYLTLPPSFRNKYRYAIKIILQIKLLGYLQLINQDLRKLNVNTKLITNEDFEFNKRLIKDAKPILIFTDLYIYYKPRDNLDFAKQYYKYENKTLYEKFYKKNFRNNH